MPIHRWARSENQKGIPREKHASWTYLSTFKPKVLNNNYKYVFKILLREDLRKRFKAFSLI